MASSVRLLFGFSFAVITAVAGRGIMSPLSVYRQTSDWRALAIALTWTGLCLSSAGMCFWLLMIT